MLPNIVAKKCGGTARMGTNGKRVSFIDLEEEAVHTAIIIIAIIFFDSWHSGGKVR